MEKDKKFDFDDILIVSDYYTNIDSRYDDIELDGFPLITAPMDTVVDLTNIDLFIEQGIVVALPRTVQYRDYLKHIKESKKPWGFYKNTFISLGLKEVQEIINGTRYVSKDENILIDVANGHMRSLHHICDSLGHCRPDINLMVGNIANPDTYRIFCEYKNVKYVRCGIGNGNGCLTTKSTSVGYPMASLISEIKTIKNKLVSEGKHAPNIIADGGMKDYSDVIKALYLGADNVMIGSIFNKALESCGNNYYRGIKINKKIASYLFSKGYKVKKHFRGMSTKEAQKAMGKKYLKTSEGVVRYRNVEYTLSGWFENFNHYLRSAMSYTDSFDIKDFIGKSRYCFITTNAYNRFNK